MGGGEVKSHCLISDGFVFMLSLRQHVGENQSG